MGLDEWQDCHPRMAKQCRKQVSPEACTRGECGAHRACEQNAPEAPHSSDKEVRCFTPVRTVRAILASALQERYDGSPQPTTWRLQTPLCSSDLRYERCYELLGVDWQLVLRPHLKTLN